MVLACHHTETIPQEKTTREASRAVEKQPGQIRDAYDVAEDSAKQANLNRNVGQVSMIERTRHGTLFYIIYIFYIIYGSVSNAKNMGDMPSSYTL